jgi:hypothetical protein
MIKKRVAAAIALFVAAGAVGLTPTSASAAHFDFFFGVPGPYYPPAYYPPAYYPPAPPRSCWQWSAYYQTSVWARAVPHPRHYDDDDFRHCRHGY